jgi:hypothetical protein
VVQGILTKLKKRNIRKEKEKEYERERSAKERVAGMRMHH